MTITYTVTSLRRATVSGDFGDVTFSDGRTFSYLRLPAQVGGGYSFAGHGKRKDGFSKLPHFRSPRRELALATALQGV